MKKLIAIPLLLLLTANVLLAQVRIPSSSDPSKNTTKNEAENRKNIQSTTSNTGEISSVHRLHFYTGASFTQTFWAANNAEEYGGGDPDVNDKVFNNAKILGSILKGTKEQQVLQSDVKKLHAELQYGEFAGRIVKLGEEYIKGLTKEQLWYFQVGEVCSEIKEGVYAKSEMMFILSDVRFVDIFKNIPDGIPSNLVAALKKTAELSNTENFSLTDSDEDKFKIVYTQLGKVYELLGKMTAEDLRK